MSFILYIVFAIEAILGIGTCIYIVVSLIGTIGYKIIHKIKDHTSIMD